MYMRCLIFAILFASRLRPAVRPVRDLDWCPWGWSSQGEVLVYMHSPFEVISAIAVQYSSNIIVPVEVYRFTVGWCAYGSRSWNQTCTACRVVWHGWSKTQKLSTGIRHDPHPTIIAIN